MIEDTQTQSPTEALVCRFYREGDEEGLLRLFTAAFDGWPKPELSVSPLEHLRWKLHSDEGGARHHIVGEIDGEIVAARIHVIQRLKAGDRTLLGRQTVDQSVLPRYHRTGVMTKLRKFGRDEILSVYDIGFMYTSGHPGMKRLVPKQYIPTEYFGNETDVLNLDLLEPPIAKPPPAHETVELPAFDERFDQFWSDASAAFDCIVVRDCRYLTWRFDARGGLYRIRAIEDAGRLLGYTVLSTSRGRGCLADILTLPARLDVVGSLVEDAIVVLCEAGVSTVECLMPRLHPYRDALRECGFRRKRRRLTFGYQPLLVQSAELSFFHDPELRFHATMADTDLV